MGINVFRNIQTVEPRLERAQEEKLFNLNNSVLCALINSMGAQYGIGATAGSFYDWQHKAPKEANCYLKGTLCRWANLTSTEFIHNTTLLDRLLRCMSKQEVATGKEYAEVANYFATGTYVKEDAYTTEILYERAVAKGYHPAIVRLFQHKCREPRWSGSKNTYKDLDAIYKNYKAALQEGMIETDMTEVESYLVRAVEIEKKAENGDKDAIRTIADYYRKTHNGAINYKYMSRLADMGEEDGILFMSARNFENTGNLHKKEKALVWHIKGAELGYGECMYRAGRMYEVMSKEQPKYIEPAIRYHEMAAEKGIVESMYRLSRLYGNGENGHYDQEKANYYLFKAYEFGHKNARLETMCKKKEPCE